ncbi:MAG: FtsX-like permease family protein [Lachnospiraceae bacterium]|nr:FtsX-like permease family protein [Lachnospiraceae bacterium]
MRSSFNIVEGKMINQLKFVIGWTKYNRVMTGIFVTILSMIVCSSILLIQFFWDQSTYDQDGRYYYCYYFDADVGNDIAEQILYDLRSMEIEPLEYAVAAKMSECDTGNEYTFCAYYCIDDNEQILRNENYDYGFFRNETNTYIADNISAPLDFGEFELKGKGAIIIGSCGCDYLINAKDYKKYVDRVEAIEITLTQKNNKIKDIISQYETQYTEEKSTGILESGMESIKNTAIVSFVLILVSIYSALSFIEIFIHFQRKDIAVFYQCGANPKGIRRLYLLESMLAGVVSFLLGSFIACILVRLCDFNFSKIRASVYIISFFVYNMCYCMETHISINLILRSVSMISKESE